MLQRARFLSSRAVLVGAACILTSLPVWSATAVGNGTLTFEGIADQNEVFNFYPGISFNAAASVAGHSLDATEFPPASGVTVAVPDDSPISMTLELAVTNFHGRFTHTDPITLVFSLGGNIVGSASSVFHNNLALSGDTGSTPNETISFHGAAFDSVFVDGGGAITMDDVSFAASTGAPEPGTVVMLSCGLILTLAAGYRKSRRARK